MRKMSWSPNGRNCIKDERIFKMKRNETKRNETKRNETKRNETKRNETKRNETKQYDAIQYDTIRYNTIRKFSSAVRVLSNTQSGLSGAVYDFQYHCKYLHAQPVN
jgi:hypothetical protein